MPLKSRIYGSGLIFVNSETIIVVVKCSAMRQIDCAWYSVDASVTFSTLIKRDHICMVERQNPSKPKIHISCGSNL